MFRQLAHHVLIKISTGVYHLEGHPEVTIHRYQGGQGNRGYKGWEVRFNGRSRSMSPGHPMTFGDLDDVDRELLRYGDCADCGKFSCRWGHRPDRCDACGARHNEMAHGYRRAAVAVERIERAWALAEAVRNAPSIEAATALIAS